MAKHPIATLQVDRFGPIGHAFLQFSPTLNVITGDNATGKSQLLKLLYTCTRELAVSVIPAKGALASSIAAGLVGVLRPDKLGRLASRNQGRSRAAVALRFKGLHDKLEFSFASNATSEVQLASFPQSALGDTPVFLPSRELLSLYPGLAALFETRELEFDETWRDTALLLGRPALRGPRSDTASKLLAPLLAIIEGQVVEEAGKFYIRWPAGSANTGKIEAHLVSEGFRKIAMVIRLVSNGVLLEGGYLFWDEPEANLNPKTQRAVAAAILALARSGTQVFVATHSMYLLRELELQAESSPSDSLAPTHYIGLYRDASAAAEAPLVTAEWKTDAADLSSIAALDAESDQSFRYLRA